MKQLLITIPALVLVGCGKETEVFQSKEKLIKGDAKVSFTTKHRDGKMLLKAKVFPYKGTVEKTLNLSPNAEVAIVSSDVDGFEIFEQVIALKGMKRMGEDYLEKDFQRNMTKEKYNSIKKYNIGRVGFVE